MSLRIQTNATAINSQRQLGISDSAMSKSLEKLSSGYRINRAADDAAGLSMSNKFVAQVKGMNVASRNASQANSLLQIAEGGLDQIGNILSRMKELATQASSANNSQNLTDINAESQALISEIDRISASTTFQGTSLLDGNYGSKVSDWTAVSGTTVDYSGATAGTYSVTFDSTNFAVTMKNATTGITQVLSVASSTTSTTFNFSALGVKLTTDGVSNNQTYFANLDADDTFILSVVGNTTFQIGETNGTNYQLSFTLSSATATGLSVNSVSLLSATTARTAMDSIDAAISSLSSKRAGIGAVMNRLDYTSANLATAIENASSANSVIKDVDMASEMTNFTKNQILVQAGTAMLAQANQSPQLILSLLK